MSNGTFDSNIVDIPAVAAIGGNGANGIDATSESDGGVAVYALGTGPCAIYAEGLEGGPGVFGYSDTGTAVVAAAMQGIGLQAFGGGIIDFGLVPPPQLPPDIPAPVFPQAGISAMGSPGVYGSGTTGADGVAGSSTSSAASGVSGNNTGGGTGVAGSSTSGTGGVFQSQSGAQVQLVPSSTPLQDSPLFASGQVGDLYLYSVVRPPVIGGERGVSSFGFPHQYETILWLCIAPSGPGHSATWAQVQLGDIAVLQG